MELTEEQLALLRSATLLYRSESYSSIGDAARFQQYYLKRPVWMSSTAGIQYVRIHKYRRDTENDASSPDTHGDGRILDHLALAAWRQAQEALRTWNGRVQPRDSSERNLVDRVWRWRGEGRLTNVFNGKAYPKDIGFLLTVLIVIGHLPANPIDVQRYCDMHIGMDCSGFVNNYFIARGHAADNRRSRNVLIRRLAASSRQLNAIPASPADHILAWTRNLNIGTEPGSHIAVINGWEARPDRLRVSESGASVRGLRTTIYHRVSGPDSHNVWRFYSEARGNEQRLLLALPRRS